MFSPIVMSVLLEMERFFKYSAKPAVSVTTGGDGRPGALAGASRNPTTYQRRAREGLKVTMRTSIYNTSR